MNNEETMKLSDEVRCEILRNMAQHRLNETCEFFNNSEFADDTFEYFEHPAIDGIPSEELQNKTYKIIDNICDLITPEFVKSIEDMS